MHIGVLLPATAIAVKPGVVTAAPATLVSARGRPANPGGPPWAAINPAGELERARRHRTARRTPQPATITKTWSRRRAAVSTRPPPPELDQGTRRPVETHNADRGRLALTTRESDLLAFLPRHPARAWSRAELLDKIWGLAARRPVDGHRPCPGGGSRSRPTRPRPANPHRAGSATATNG
ncbi:hypothetical protein DMB66_53780 [Actinoplanes sp. ATCC 53533]|uniref:winged helix-turn-helix domain-containing protein n=1 Tax=Actinoplanes sp. ATCC 53533 TaxID=1288362 RepID=UPI000F777B12|nr:hypothetical protein DMB66_53780 [Actinoplanes sp. ATCC 53533]